MTHTVRIYGLVVAALAAACGRGDDASQTEKPGAVSADSQMSAMPGMSASPASLMDRMMASMDTALRRIEGASGDSLVALLPAHRQALANLIAQMNSEMRGMNMTGDAAWAATIDSLRQDLVALPELGRAELLRVMPAHRTRILRLMERHRTMMRGM